MSFVTSSEPTSYLQVTWYKNTSKYVSKQSLRDLIEAKGGDVLTICFSEKKKRTAYVEFRSTGSAKRVRDSLHRKICHEMGSKVLNLEYVEKIQYEEKLVRDSKIECTSKTSEISIPGLTILEDFISSEEETSLLQILDQKSEKGIYLYWKTHLSRRVAHFQYSFDYETTEIDRDSRDRTPDIPPTFQVIAKRIEKITKIKDFSIDQITANEYLPSQGIAPHVDTTRSFTGTIVSLCLFSGCVFTLRDVRNSKKHKSIYHRPRSLIIMTGPARFDYQHYIAPRKGDVVDGKYIPRSRRVSLTFRQILQPGVEMESKHVDAFYEVAANHFSKTRGGYLWPEVKTYIRDVLGKSSSVRTVLDVGCGNGRYVDCCVREGFAYVGGDRCCELMETCAYKNVFTRFDATSLPFRENSFDACLSIACLHHLSTVSRRIRALMEIARVVRTGGYIYLTVWRSTRGENDDKKGEDRFVSWQLQSCYLSEDESRYSVHAQRMLSESSSRFESSESSRVLKRFCHLFGRCELRMHVDKASKLLMASSKKRIKIVSEVLDERNVYLSCRVVSDEC